MSKFKPGQTSDRIRKRKSDITRSMLAKAEAINLVKTIDEVPSSLELKGNYISEASVYKWSDDKLSNILSFSRNTAFAEHNAQALKVLRKSLKRANNNLAVKQNSKSSKYLHNHDDDALSMLRKENEDLKIALAEVYRAYLQVIDNYQEDKQADESFRSLILEQARVLGKKRLWQVK
ncbi:MULTISPECIES: hypothetical protein [unclassified Idiomarina]|uniref:hypothetical protein n=1 Tax=unclassified Idiomarina TaxID=2614829 RepID=UPI0025811887|nr:MULTISPECIES: hypothetical protein [unclassified Idiomarina]